MGSGYLCYLTFILLHHGVTKHFLIFFLNKIVLPHTSRFLYVFFRDLVIVLVRV